MSARTLPGVSVSDAPATKRVWGAARGAERALLVPLWAIAGFLTDWQLPGALALRCSAIRSTHVYAALARGACCACCAQHGGEPSLWLARINL